MVDPASPLQLMIGHIRVYVICVIGPRQQPELPPMCLVHAGHRRRHITNTSFLHRTPCDIYMHGIGADTSQTRHSYTGHHVIFTCTASAQTHHIIPTQDTMCYLHARHRHRHITNTSFLHRTLCAIYMHGIGTDTSQTRHSYRGHYVLFTCTASAQTHHKHVIPTQDTM